MIIEKEEWKYARLSRGRTLMKENAKACPLIMEGAKAIFKGKPLHSEA